MSKNQTTSNVTPFNDKESNQRNCWNTKRNKKLLSAQNTFAIERQTDGYKIGILGLHSIQITLSKA